MFSGLCFLLTGILKMIDKEYLSGILYIFISVPYISATIFNYKKDNTPTIIKDADIDLEVVDTELRNLLAEGKKYEAIKRYRMVTGLGLKEAKEHIDLLDEKI